MLTMPCLLLFELVEQEADLVFESNSHGVQLRRRCHRRHHNPLAEEDTTHQNPLQITEVRRTPL
jgi:hypothetical protein